VNILKTDLRAYLTGYTEPIIISILYDRNWQTTVIDALTDNTTNPASPIVSFSQCNIPMPIGVMISRSATISFFSSQFIENSNVSNRYNCYFWDFITIHREHKHKNLARNLIQTHENRQRLLNPNVLISLFKKEIELCSGIVPLVQYQTITYSMNPFFKNSVISFPSHIVLIRVIESNVHLLVDFLKNQENLQINKNTGFFAFSAIADIGSLISLIRTQILFVYCLKKGEDIYAWYFFKDAKMNYEDFAESSNGTLQSIASISNVLSGRLFLKGFFAAILNILKTNPQFSVLSIENISHNSILISGIRQMSNTADMDGLTTVDKMTRLRKLLAGLSMIFENPTAYYLYNFVYPSSPIFAENVFFLLG